MKSIVVLLGLIFSFVSYAEEVLYCTIKKGSGIYYKNNKPNAYTLDGTPFSINIHNNFESIIVKQSSGYKTFKCTETQKDYYYVCNEFVGNKVTGNSIRYNSQNNHFVRIYSTFLGYIFDGSFKIPDFILVGKCEKF